MLTVDKLRSVLAYDPDTGVFTWLRTLNARAPKGSRAGSVRPDGYRSIGLFGEQYLSHRLAVFYTTGRWPVADVDHKNLIPGDDRWCNLREASCSQNKGNVRPPVTNTSGHKGVTWNKKDKRWRAQIRVSGRRRIIGGFIDKRDAVAAYEHAAKIAFGEFARTA